MAQRSTTTPAASSGKPRSRRRPGGASHPGGRVRAKSAVLLAVVAVLLGAVAVFADSGNLDVQVADSLGYEFDTTDDGAIVEYIGKDNTDFGSTGTGVINSFLQTQDTPSEEGYNTNGTKQFDTGSSPTFNRAILVSEIPVVACEALDPTIVDPAETGFCWELFSDINDSNANDPAAAQIQLTELELWLTDDENLTGYVQAGDAGFGAGDADKVYDFEGVILINDVNSGSGRGDMRYLVPLTGIDLATLAPDCDYGSTDCETYFVVYTEWGDPDEEGDYISDSGFEEWTVKRYPFLEVSKTATTTFTRTFPWTITKSVTPDSWALFDGDSGTSDYTVALVKGAGVDSAWAVSGSILIENNSDQDAPIASVTDVISGVGAATVVCPVTFPFTLPDGDDLTCTYSSALPNGTNRTNTATATLTTGPIFTGTAPVTFGAPTTLVNDTVHVTDTFAGGPQNMAFSATGSTTYSRTFECGDDEGTHNNTATIVETSQSDSASVTVTCYDLTVTKDAVPAFSRDFDWTIEKSVDPESLDMFDGDSDDVTWTVIWTKGAADDFGYAVSGTITVANNHPTSGAVINSLADVINPGAIGATVDCAPATFPHTIAAGGSLVCTYEATLPDDADRTNRATATQQNYDYASDLTATADGTTEYFGEADIDFEGVTPTVTDDTATLSDARPGNTIDGDNVSTSGSDSWDETFECGADEGSHTNTARVTEDDSADFDEDDATTVVNCYELTVEKDANTSFDRDYNWTVAKTRVFAEGEDDGDLDPTTLTIDPNQTYTLTYEITVDLAVPPYVDSNWAVDGTITVNNPAPIAADDVVVTDMISGYGAADHLDCDDDVGEQTTVDIPAASSVQCTYSAALSDATTRTNTATATLFGIGYDGTASVDFGTADITEIDECVVVTDDNGTPGDTSDDTVLDASLCASEAPQTYTNTIDVGPFEVCGEFTFINTAHIVTVDDANDTGENHSASYTVIITVPCPEGCTLTPGYWKTHNEEFWGGAPEDPNWYLIGDVDGDGLSEGPNEEFFDTGDTWFEVFWTNPAGRPYYQLSFQYMAAVLNKLSIEDEGGTIPAAVQDAIDDAAALLDEYDGSEAGKTPDIKGKDAKTIRAQFVTLAGILGSFNEGTFPGGPLHCDEDASSTLSVLAPIWLLAPVTAWMRRRARR